MAALVVKKLPVNAGDLRDMGYRNLTPGFGRSPGGGHGNHSSILAWRSPGTKEPGGLQSIGLQTVRQDCSGRNRTNTSIISRELLCVISLQWGL